MSEKSERKKKDNEKEIMFDVIRFLLCNIISLTACMKLEMLYAVGHKHVVCRPHYSNLDNSGTCVFYSPSESTEHGGAHERGKILVFCIIKSKQHISKARIYNH